jgi:phosphinothricin acetyltransferase
MTIAPCTRTQTPEILSIFNDAIVNTTALYEYEPRTPEFMATWFDTKESSQLPILGAFTDDGTLAGFATYGTFRTLPAYKHTAEHSVYVHPDHRGHGIGRRLLRDLIATARTQDYHVLIGVIDSANAASIALHRAFGFVHSGTLREVGYKFDRWLDVDLYQLTLPTSTRLREK